MLQSESRLATGPVACESAICSSGMPRICSRLCGEDEVLVTRCPGSTRRQSFSKLAGEASCNSQGEFPQPMFPVLSTSRYSTIAVLGSQQKRMKIKPSYGTLHCQKVQSLKAASVMIMTGSC